MGFCTALGDICWWKRALQIHLIDIKEKSITTNLWWSEVWWEAQEAGQRWGRRKRRPERIGPWRGGGDLGRWLTDRLPPWKPDSFSAGGFSAAPTIWPAAQREERGGWGGKEERGKRGKKERERREGRGKKESEKERRGRREREKSRGKRKKGQRTTLHDSNRHSHRWLLWPALYNVFPTFGHTVAVTLREVNRNTWHLSVAEEVDLKDAWFPLIKEGLCVRNIASWDRK